MRTCRCCASACRGSLTDLQLQPAAALIATPEIFEKWCRSNTACSMRVSNAAQCPISSARDTLYLLQWHSYPFFSFGCCTFYRQLATPRFHLPGLIDELNTHALFHFLMFQEVAIKYTLDVSCDGYSSIRTHLLWVRLLILFCVLNAGSPYLVCVVC